MSWMEGFFGFTFANSLNGHQQGDWFNNDVWGFPGGPVVKNPPASAGDAGSVPGLGRCHSNEAAILSPRAAAAEACAP